MAEVRPVGTTPRRSVQISFDEREQLQLLLASRRAPGTATPVHMRAVGVTTFGGPEALEVVELPERHAGPGEVRIRVHAAAVNPTDTYAATESGPSS